MGNTHRFRARGKDFDLGLRTWLIGVVNVTPDSFFNGGLYFEPARAIERALALVAEGADIIDIGGESSRPGSSPIPAQEEKKRILPVIEVLKQKKDALISVDTSKAEVAEAALAAGADIINDISAGRFDPRMLPLVGRYGAGLILMHMKGTPRTMQLAPHYDDVVGEVKAFLGDRLEAAISCGVSPENTILDPGIGFGKTLEHNLRLLNGLASLAELGRPLLIGVSRKSFIGKILEVETQDRLEGTIAASIVGLLRGATLLRVHDIQPVRRAVAVAEAILSQGALGLPPEGRGKPYVH
ncbi:MAG: dihydropteroate synthase [Candidatus Aminicenantes bacterium]|nr:dihydropteroate synthase [Candidatus Aminicenantes bacterium]